ncbi:MAG: hypothetical protein ACRDS9_04290 [Pseudonocardiaceae bacterium]
MGFTVAGFALLGALMACGYRPDQVGLEGQRLAQVSGTSASTVDREVLPNWPAPPHGVRPLPSAQIDSSALPPDYPRLAWTQDEGRMVVGIYGQEGGCTHAHADLREQTPGLVRIAVVEVTTSSGPCTMDLRYPSLAVQLDAPLGDRTVVLERQTISPPPRR